MRLRKSVGAFIVNKKGEFLLLYRKDEIGTTYWDILRGGIEKGETQLEALKREIKEEFSISNSGKITKLNLSFRFEFPDKLKEVVRFDKQKVDLFLVRLGKEKIKVDKKEILDFQFVDRKKFMSTVTFDTTRKAFQRMIKKIKI